MANPTTNYGWVLPTSTDLVTDLPADFDVALQGVDTRLKALQPGTTLGDLAYSSATANTNTRLGIGTAGQVLTVAAGVPSWATASSGGMTVIASGSLSGTAVALTSIPATYKHLQLVMRNFQRSTDGLCALRFNNDSATRYALTASTGVADEAFSSTAGRLTDDQDSATGSGLVIADIYDYANTTTWKISHSKAMTNFTTGGTSANYYEYKTMFNQTGAISQINILLTTGTFTGGTYILYGVQ